MLERAWAAGAGPGAAPLTIDLDSRPCAKLTAFKSRALKNTPTTEQGATTRCWRLPPDRARCCSRACDGEGPTPAGARPISLTETISRVRQAGAPGELTVRADSGFYNRTVIGACRKLDVRFSVTVRLGKSLRALIEEIPEEAWAPIRYWLPGAADVAEIPYVPFQGRVRVRLIVRRVKPTPGSQLALLTNYSYHGCVTDREGAMLDLEAGPPPPRRSRARHQCLKYGVGLNHLPSGRFAANGAWLAVQVMAHNLGRWLLRIGMGKGIVTTPTLRRRFFALPGRITRSARKFTLHLPAQWPWAKTFELALERLRALPNPI